MTYTAWLDEAKSALREINMPFDQWQHVWPFDFEREHQAGASPTEAAKKANRYWWYNQNKAIQQECRKTPNCWLPNRHAGECQLV